MRRWLALGACLPLWAASTTTWEMSTYQDFVAGTFEGVGLTRDGRLVSAPRLDALFTSDQPAIWSVVEDRGGVIYAGTGHRGRVFRVEPSGKSSVYWSAEEPEVFALALDAKGALFAATSPDGKVYRIERGKATEYFKPQAKYIWALAAGPDGALYVGAGEPGKIFRVTAPGKGEVYYDSGQAHITSLVFDREGRLLAGTEPNGLLYRIAAKDKAFVLMDANFPEIRSIVPAADGSLYVAALGGSVAKKAQAAQDAGKSGTGSQGATPVTTITVTADAAQKGLEVKPVQDQAKAAAPTPAASATMTPIGDVAGIDKSGLFRIHPDNTVETLWISKEENAYDLLVRDTGILFSTDQSGRIYRLTPDRKVSLVAQTNESETTRLIARDQGVLAATSNLGKIYRLGAAPAPGGNYLSPVHDAGTVARWGQLDWRAGSGQASFRTRSGNSSRPDATWSDWSEPMAAPAKMPSPNARYAQWKMEFTGEVELDSVTLSYLPQNRPPVIRAVNAQYQSVAAPAKPAGSTTSAADSYSVTVTETGEAGTQVSTGTPTQLLQPAATTTLWITWQAEDPDGDKLVYSLEFRGDGEREWKLLKRGLADAYHSLDNEALADGRYVFRVTASDREANPDGDAREAQLTSSPVLLDHTPPSVSVRTSRNAQGDLEILMEAVDQSSPIRRCEYSIDAGAWMAAKADDGVLDSQKESCSARVTALAPGEHIVVVRAADAARNTGLAKTVVR